MTSRAVAGSVLAYVYNSMVGRLPMSAVRASYLKAYLGAFGDDSSIQGRCRFLNGRKVFLGARNVVNFGCLFDGRHYTIHTGADVSIGPEAAILTLGHDPHDAQFANKGGDVWIRDRVWIAYRAIILPGVTIGEGAVIAAGAVISRNVEPFAIMAGSPARKVGERNRDLTYRLSYRPFLT